MLTAKRRRQLRRRYARAVEGATQAETTHQWSRYLAALYLEGGDLRIFLDLRTRARANGARLDQALMDGTKTPRQVFGLIRERCADVYATALVRYRIAEIDITSPEYRRITRKLALEVLQAFDGIDATDKTAVCTAMAKTWHQFVRSLHARYGLPSVRALKARIGHESDAERDVIETDDFETRMTARQRADWEALVG